MFMRTLFTGRGYLLHRVHAAGRPLQLLIQLARVRVVEAAARLQSGEHFVQGAAIEVITELFINYYEWPHAIAVGLTTVRPIIIRFSV